MSAGEDRRERSHEFNVALGDSAPADARRPLTASGETTPGEAMSDGGGPAERLAKASTKAPVMLTDAWRLARTVAEAHDGEEGDAVAECAIVAARLEVRRALRDMIAAMNGSDDMTAIQSVIHDAQVGAVRAAAVALFGDDWEAGL